jgi:large subunit ribosomal protein L3
MKFIIGKKIGMSQFFDQNGKVIPVTLVEAGPCYVTQIKNQEKDNYQAVQIAFDSKKKIAKPQQGHYKKAQDANQEIENINFKWAREFCVEKIDGFKLGDKITVETFQEGDKVEVCGISKGKGFQGVVKRHGFKGGPASHGDKDRMRAPGSIGCAFPQRVWKGRRMAGRMGQDQVTQKGLKVVFIDKEENLLAIKGAVPGSPGTLLAIIS